MPRPIQPQSPPAPVSPPPNCLNCGAAVPKDDVFCGKCGQENEATAVSFAAMVREAWDEFIKIDRKLLDTLRFLVFRPGYLTGEYVQGRRTAYLSPFKMYLAVSAVFFLVWGLIVPFDRLNDLPAQAAAMDKRLAEAQAKAKARKASGAKTVTPVVKKAESAPDDKITNPVALYRAMRKSGVRFFNFYVPFDGLPATVSEYRDAEAQKPSAKRDAPAIHYLKERVIRFNSDPADAAKSLFSSGLPLLLLIHLPLFAAWMRVIYYRQRRLYVEHLAFLLHTHTFFFLVTGLLFLVDAVVQSFGTPLAFLDASATWGVLLLVVTVYNVLAYRRFYGQGWGKTLIKGWFLMNGYLFLLAFTLGIATILSLVWTIIAPG